MNKVKLYIATSLDGYIADTSGNVNFLDTFEPTQDAIDAYNSFYNSIGTVIMGNSTYKQVITDLSPNLWPYENCTTYVYTNTKKENINNIIFTNENPTQLINTIKSSSSEDIWLLGGSQIVQTFLEHNLIDEYIITIVPVILGNGIKLFNPSIFSTSLKLVSSKNIGEFVELTYSK